MKPTYYTLKEHPGDPRCVSCTRRASKASKALEVTKGRERSGTGSFNDGTEITAEEAVPSKIAQRDLKGEITWTPQLTMSLGGIIFCFFLFKLGMDGFFLAKALMMVLWLKILAKYVLNRYIHMTMNISVFHRKYYITHSKQIYKMVFFFLPSAMLPCYRKLLEGFQDLVDSL